MTRAGATSAREALAVLAEEHGWTVGPGIVAPEARTVSRYRRGDELLVIHWFPAGAVRSATRYVGAYGAAGGSITTGRADRRRALEKLITSRLEDDTLGRVDNDGHSGVVSLMSDRHQPEEHTLSNATATQTTASILHEAARNGNGLVFATGREAKAERARIVTDHVGTKSVTYVAVASDGTVVTRSSGTMVYTHAVVVLAGTDAQGRDHARTETWGWTGGGLVGTGQSSAKSAAEVYGRHLVEVVEATPMTAEAAKALAAGK